MKKLVIAIACISCKTGTTQTAEPTTKAATPWDLPAQYRSEVIPFPLEFAPGLAHTGVEELRFAPGFFDPAAPGYWSYAFVWRTDDAAALDATALANELTTYFHGLAAAVDEKHEIANLDTIAATAKPDGARFALHAHMIDAFKTKQPVELVGWAERHACSKGAVWAFVLAPEQSTLHAQLDTLAQGAACDQPVLKR